MSKRKHADTEAAEHEDTQAPEHADAQVPEHAGTPEEAAMLETLEKEAGVDPVAADTSAPVVPEDLPPWKLEGSTEPEHQSPEPVIPTEAMDRIVSLIPVLPDPPATTGRSEFSFPFTAEAQERAAALDAEYATARAEVAATGYRRTVHCRKCGTVVSLGEACPVDALIAA